MGGAVLNLIVHRLELMAGDPSRSVATYVAPHRVKSAIHVHVKSMAT